MADTDWTTLEAKVKALSHIGNDKIIYEKTMAAAATIAPTTFHTILTGTTQVSTITIPFVGFSGTLAFTFTNGSPGATLTTGNIVLATTVVQYKTVLMTYSQQTSKWYPSY